jgi:hypothetical protein
MTPLAQSASNTAAWYTLLGALGGVLLTSAFSLTTAILNQRWQTMGAEHEALEKHVKELRRERRETYAAYWLAWNRLSHALVQLGGEAEKSSALGEEQLEKRAPKIAEGVRNAELGWRAAGDAIFLIGSQGVIDAAIVHFQTTDAKLAAAWRGELYPDEIRTWKKLVDAMRTELLRPPKAEPEG